MGYLIGALFCVITWKADRHFLWKKLICRINIEKYKSKVLEIFLLVTAAGAGYLLYRINLNIKYKAVIEGIALFLSVEANISHKKIIDMKKKKKRKLYRMMTSMSDSFICGITAPLIYILILGNYAGVVYACIYYLSDIRGFKLTDKIFSIMNMLPSLYGGALLYLIYVLRNRTFRISFNGEYLKNLIYKPLLNIYILAAYIESVNYYYIAEEESVNYIKGYGGYICRIDEICITDYLSILYGFGILSFILFVIIVK